MSLQQLHAFIDHIQTQANPQLKQDLGNASAAQELTTVVAIANQAAFAVDESDRHELHAQQTANLSDDHLK